MSFNLNPIKAIRNILPSLGTYCVVIVCIYTCFAIVGMESFQGLIADDHRYDDPTRRNCRNKLLLGEDFAVANYCKNNFNDFIHAFITLFELTVVNQWHIITRGYVTVTNGGAYIFFILFHMVQVSYLCILSRSPCKNKLFWNKLNFYLNFWPEKHVNCHISIVYFRSTF